MSEHPVRNTFLATITVLIFFFAQGAVVVMGELEGLKAIVVQTSIIWCCALAAIICFLMKEHRLASLGFQKPVKGSTAGFLYYIPLIAIALVAFAGGLKQDESGLILPNLIFTLGIGLTEEVYFRGIICNSWREKEKAAILISSVLFGLSHFMNIMGGAGLAGTLLQIVFAFVYGIVMALVMLGTKSILPCIFLHAFHDFCGFITGEGNEKLVIIVGTIQFVVLLAYCIYLVARKNGLYRRIC
ncbi:MAG: CPBP family intramembrane metalloprotease [Lachnospiraceae bacterium]|nr:CPBP family intramembrane metalloprotease [Lachnospiraceae bacterium]